MVGSLGGARSDRFESEVAPEIFYAVLRIEQRIGFVNTNGKRGFMYLFDYRKANEAAEIPESEFNHLVELALADCEDPDHPVNQEILVLVTEYMVGELNKHDFLNKIESLRERLAESEFDKKKMGVA